MSHILNRKSISCRFVTFYDLEEPSSELLEVQYEYISANQVTALDKENQSGEDWAWSLTNIELQMQQNISLQIPIRNIEMNWIEEDNL